MRYLWDNASVLKMVRLIASRHSWPIIGESQIVAFKEPSRFRLNPFGAVVGTTSGSSTPRPYRVSALWMQGREGRGGIRDPTKGAIHARVYSIELFLGRFPPLS